MSERGGFGKLDLIVTVVIFICLLSIVVPLYQNRQRQSEAATAINLVNQLYQSQVVQYFSAKKFAYSLTRIQSWPDFFRARPPRGKAELLEGYPGDSKSLNKAGETAALTYVAWDKVGFALVRPSYYIYRVEPEPSYMGIAKPGDKRLSHYHFHAIALGDSDGDGIYSIFMRGAYVDRAQVFHGQRQLVVVNAQE